MSRPRVALVAALTALALAISAPASAQRRDLGHALTGDARRDYELARELYRSGDNAGALAKFRHAHDLSSDPRLLWNMSVCLKNLHQYDKALPLVDQYLTSGATLTTAERTEATEFRAALTALVAPVTITSAPPGAEVFLDGARLGVTPLDGPVTVIAGVAGTRQFRFHLDGYKDRTLSPDIAGGAPFALRAELTRDVHEGRLLVVAKPKDVIQVDGRPVGDTQWSGTLSSAPHVVIVSGDGKKSQRHEVTVKDNEQRSLYVELEEESSSKWPWLVGGGALLATGLVVGGYFLFRPTSTPGPTTHGSLGTYPLP